jgi:hypothetical protein
MKKSTTGLLTALLFATSLPVLADRSDGRNGRHFQPDRYERHYDQRPRHGHQNHQGYNAAWGVLGAGLALGAFALAIESPRPPVVVAPVIAPPNNLWYYCESYRAYYPRINYCPEGWRVIPAY